MNKDFKAKVNELIREQLPTAVGTQLQALLSDYERLQKAEKSTQDTLRYLRDKNNELEDVAAKHAALDVRLNDIEVREANVVERERNAKVVSLEGALAAEAKYSEKITMFMINMSHNTVYRRHISGSVPGHDGYPQNMDKHIEDREE